MVDLSDSLQQKENPTQHSRENTDHPTVVQCWTKRRVSKRHRLILYPFNTDGSGIIEVTRVWFRLSPGDKHQVRQK